jgi:uncharacterized protein (DUF983 family)
MSSEPRYWKCPECEEVWMVDGLLPQLTICQECETEVVPKDHELSDLEFWQYCNELKNGC